MREMSTPHSPSRVLLEVIATSLADARAATAGGADRIELCAALRLGGLTPSLGLLDAGKATIELPGMLMLPPRGAGFAYAEKELSGMQRGAELAPAPGADGVGVGC